MNNILKNKRKNSKRIHYGSLAWNILKIAGAGAILLSLFALPHIGKALAPFLRDANIPEKDWRRDNVRDAIARLRRRRYVKLIERGGESYLVVSKYGQECLRRFDFDNINIKKPWRWDKKWRLVIFDIPERLKKRREAIRYKLNSIGFIPIQKSVFVHPYPCEDEIDFLCNFLSIQRYVYCLKAESLGNAEIKIRSHFDLLCSGRYLNFSNPPQILAIAKN